MKILFFRLQLGCFRHCSDYSAGSATEGLLFDPLHMAHTVLRARIRGTIPPLSHKLSCLDSVYMLPELRFFGNGTERDHLEQVGVGWRIILKRIFKVGWGGLD